MSSSLAGSAAGAAVAALRDRGSSSAAATAAATATLPTQTAGARPETNAAPLAYPPRAENTAPRTAIPNTPPSSRIALLAPEAMPSWSRRTEPRTTLATGAKKSDIPIPETMNAGTWSM